IELLVGSGGELAADEIIQIKARIGNVLALIGHEVGQVADLLVSPVRADQVGVVDPAVMEILAGLHLRLDFLDDIPFLDNVVRDLDTGNGGKSGGQHLGFVVVGGQGFGN